MTTEREKTLNIWEALVLLFCLMPLAQIVRGVVAPILEPLRLGWAISPAVWSTGMAALVQAAVMVGGILVCVRGLHKVKLSRLGLRLPRRKGWVVAALLSGALLFAVMLVISLALSALLPAGLAPQPAAEVMAQAQSRGEKLILLFAVGVLAPISEEMLFRGFIYGALAERLTQPAALGLSALIFATMHGDLWRLLPLALSGLWLNVIYLKTDSLYPAMVAHGVWNMLMAGLIYGV